MWLAGRTFTSGPLCYEAASLCYLRSQLITLYRSSLLGAIEVLAQSYELSQECIYVVRGHEMCYGLLRVPLATIIDMLLLSRALSWNKDQYILG